MKKIGTQSLIEGTCRYSIFRRRNICLAIKRYKFAQITLLCVLGIFLTVYKFSDSEPTSKFAHRHIKQEPLIKCDRLRRSRNISESIFSQHCCSSYSDEALHTQLRLSVEKSLRNDNRCKPLPRIPLTCEAEQLSGTKHPGRNICAIVRKRPVVVIISYHDRLNHLQLFLSTINVILENDPSVYLVISSLKVDSENVKKAIAEDTSIKDASRRIFTVYQGDSSMSRGKLLNKGFNHAVTLFGRTFSVFFTDVDCLHKQSSVNRCRTLALERKTVYYPIVWSQSRPRYAPKNPMNTSVVGGNVPNGRGLWRVTAYGILCLTATDFKELGPFAEYDVWGFEDRELFEMIKKSDLQIFRFEDSGIVHKWHPKNCSDSIRRQGFWPKLLGKKTTCETVRDRHE